MASNPSAFVVRDACECDADRLTALMRGSTISGGIRWSIEPGPDPFASLRAERDGWTVALAEDESGQLLGFVSVASRSVFANGQPVRSCYVTNLKVLPEHRGRGIGDALCRRALELCRRAGGDSVPILMVVRTDNERMRRRAAGPRGLPALTKFASVEIHSIVARWAAANSRGELQVSSGRPDDLEEMVELLARVAMERQFSPAFDASELLQWIEGAPGLTLDDFLVARSRGRIVGWMGWWDEAAVRVVRIAGFTTAGAVRQVAQRAAAMLKGAPRPASVGDRIGCMRAVLACVPTDRPDVLRSLIAAGARRRGAGCSWLKIALDARDPLGHALRGLRTRVASFDARITTPSGGRDLPIDSKPFHLDAALI